MCASWGVCPSWGCALHGDVPFMGTCPPWRMCPSWGVCPWRGGWCAADQRVGCTGTRRAPTATWTRPLCATETMDRPDGGEDREALLPFCQPHLPAKLPAELFTHYTAALSCLFRGACPPLSLPPSAPRSSAPLGSLKQRSLSAPLPWRCAPAGGPSCAASARHHHGGGHGAHPSSTPQFRCTPHHSSPSPSLHPWSAAEARALRAAVSLGGEAEGRRAEGRKKGIEAGAEAGAEAGGTEVRGQTAGTSTAGAAACGGVPFGTQVPCGRGPHD